MALGLAATDFRSPPECIVTVGGEELGALYPCLAEVRVECSRREASVATLRFDSPRNQSGWAAPDAPALKPWAAIVIVAAFGTTKSEIMRGFVREIEAEYSADGRVTMRVECQDESLALDRKHERLAWGVDAPTTDATILATITAKYGLTCDPLNGTGLSGLSLHQDCTDIRFLRGRAEINGYELIIQSGSLYFGPLRLEAKPQPTLFVANGGACQRFTARADGHRPDLVGYDLGAGASVTRYIVAPNLPLLGAEPADSTSAGLQDFVWFVSRERASSAAELAALAQGKANEAAMRVTAEGELDGALYGQVLQVGLPVGVSGVGQRFGGTYYVDRVTHVLTQAGYRQEFRLLRNAFGDNLNPHLPGALAGVL